MDQLPPLDNTYGSLVTSRFLHLNRTSFPRFGAVFIGVILGGV